MFFLEDLPLFHKGSRLSGAAWPPRGKVFFFLNRPEAAESLFLLEPPLGAAAAERIPGGILEGKTF